MKMIFMWLLGVPIAVSLLFAVFAVDAEKISLRIAPPVATETFAAGPADAANTAALRQSEVR